MIKPKEALQRLQAGNQRFVDGHCTRNIREGYREYVEPTAGPAPFATVLGCSDSRVPLELIFDQGFGDLFAVRVAGNVVGPMLTGSIEFAASKFGTQLVVVLGHSRCGAVTATVDDLLAPSDEESPNLESVVQRIRPAVRKVLSMDAGASHDKLIEQSIRENVRSSAEALLRESSLLSGLVRAGRLEIVCAEYSLDTGIVEFFE